MIRKGTNKKVMITGILYGILLLTGITVTFLLVNKITIKLILSLFFVILACTVMFVLFMISMLDSRQNVIQNHAMTILGTIYFLITVVTTIMINLLDVGMKWFLSVEIVLLAFGAIVILWAYGGKIHIEKDL